MSEVERLARPIVFLLLGAFTGRFLAHCIERLGWQKSVLWPWPRCPSCLRVNSPWGGLPVVSYLVRRGKCRCCATPFGSRGLLVEILTGLLFAAAAASETSSGIRLGYHLTLISLLIVATFIDFELYVIPDAITVSGMVLGIAGGAAFPFVRWDPTAAVPTPIATHLDGLLMGVAGLVVGGALVWTVRVVGSYVFHREAMGFGDVTLLAMIGAFLGWRAAVFTFFLAPFFGLAHALAKLLVNLAKKLRGEQLSGADREMPFGPYLSMASVVLVLAWPALWWGGAKDRFDMIRVLFLFVLGQGE